MENQMDQGPNLNLAQAEALKEVQDDSAFKIHNSNVTTRCFSQCRSNHN